MPRTVRWDETRRKAVVRRRRQGMNWDALAALPRLSQTKLIPYGHYTPWSLFQDCPVCGANNKQKCHKNRKGGGKPLDRPHQERVALAQKIIAPMILPEGELRAWEREVLGRPAARASAGI